MPFRILCVFIKQQNWLCDRLSKTLSRRSHKLFLDIGIDDVSAGVHVMLSVTSWGGLCSEIFKI